MDRTARICFLGMKNNSKNISNWREHILSLFVLLLVSFRSVWMWGWFYSLPVWADYLICALKLFHEANPIVVTFHRLLALGRGYRNLRIQAPPFMECGSSPCDWCSWSDSASPLAVAEELDPKSPDQKKKKPVFFSLEPMLLLNLWHNRLRN